MLHHGSTKLVYRFASVRFVTMKTFYLLVDHSSQGSSIRFLQFQLLQSRALVQGFCSFRYSPGPQYTVSIVLALTVYGSSIQFLQSYLLQSMALAYSFYGLSSYSPRLQHAVSIVLALTVYRAVAYFLQSQLLQQDSSIQFLQSYLLQSRALAYCSARCTPSLKSLSLPGTAPRPSSPACTSPATTTVNGKTIHSDAV